MHTVPVTVCVRVHHVCSVHVNHVCESVRRVRYRVCTIEDNTAS